MCERAQECAQNNFEFDAESFGLIELGAREMELMKKVDERLGSK